MEIQQTRTCVCLPVYEYECVNLTVLKGGLLNIVRCIYVLYMRAFMYVSIWNKELNHFYLHIACTHSTLICNWKLSLDTQFSLPLNTRTHTHVFNLEFVREKRQLGRTLQEKEKSGNVVWRKNQINKYMKQRIQKVPPHFIYSTDGIVSTILLNSNSTE